MKKFVHYEGWQGNAKKEYVVPQSLIDQFYARMQIPPTRGRNKGNKRQLDNIKECAWAEFAGHPLPDRTELSDLLFQGYVAKARRC